MRSFVETVLTACGPSSIERSDCHTSGHSVGVREWPEVCLWHCLCGIHLGRWLPVGAYLTLIALSKAPSWGSYLTLPSPIGRYKYR